MKVSEKVSKEIIIISANERTELRKVSEMAVPGIIERIVKLLYFMCLVPVRPMRICKNSMHLYSRNILQKAIHVILQAGGILYTINELISLSQNQIYKKPLTILLIYIATTELGYHLWWLYAFWKKRPDLRKLLVLTTKQHNTASLQWSKVKSGFVICLPWIFITEIFFVSIVLRLANDGGSTIRPGCYSLLTWTQVANSTQNISCPNYSFPYEVILPLKIFSYLQTILTIGGHVSVVCALSILAYDTTKKFIERAQKYCEQNSTSLISFEYMRQGHIQLAQELKEYFEIVNGFGGGFFLSWFCLGVPWISYNLVQSLPGVNILQRNVLLLNWSIMLFYAFQMVYIAGARKQVEKLRDIHYEAVLQLADDPFSPEKGNSLDEIDFLLRNVGLWGGKFFMVSFTFLGSEVKPIENEPPSHTNLYWYLRTLYYSCIIPFCPELTPNSKDEYDKKSNKIQMSKLLFNSLFHDIFAEPLKIFQLFASGTETWFFVLWIRKFWIRKSILREHFLQNLIKNNEDKKLWLSTTALKGCNKIIQQYFEMIDSLQLFFERLNVFGGDIFLCTFCQIIPWVSRRIPDILPGKTESAGFSETLFRIFFICHSSLVLLLSAELRRQVEKFREAICDSIVNINSRESSEIQSILLLVHHKLKQAGMQGGRFFLFSYGFLGSILCAITVVAGAFHHIRYLINESQQNLFQKPNRIFTVFFRVIGIWYQMWWAYAFWLKRKELEALLQRLLLHGVQLKWLRIFVLASFPIFISGLLLNIMGLSAFLTPNDCKNVLRVDRFKDIICESIATQDSIGSSKSNVSFYKKFQFIDWTLKDCGLRGGNFFQFSYSFLGSTIGLVVAYAFLAMQFHLQSISYSTSS
ncbi:unnamed protein product [Orchesella dallaii]|uniref:Gustatory receptor n=1 Tax=Orchesella dallaii TaxID=48710 RepID=A0ABP1R559_9HEXA